jgi:hypothetical protein
LKEEKDGRRVLQLNDAPEEDTKEFTLGAFPAAQYQMAFVMNSAGKTIDVIR